LHRDGDELTGNAGKDLSGRADDLRLVPRSVTIVGLWLNKAKDVAIGVSDVELSAVRHVTERHDERDVRRAKAGRKALRVLNDNARVDVLSVLKSGLVTGRGRSAVEVDVTTVAADIRVEILIDEIYVEAELVTVERKRPGQVGDLEYWGDVLEAESGRVHGGTIETPN